MNLPDMLEARGRRAAAAAAITVAVAVGITASPAYADQRTFVVTLVTGQSVTVTVDVPPGTPADQISFPGLSAAVVSVTEVTAPAATPGVEVQLTPAAPPADPGASPISGTQVTPVPEDGGGDRGRKPGASPTQAPQSGEAVFTPGGDVAPTEPATGGVQAPRPGAERDPEYNRDGSPTPMNPAFSLAMPGAAPIGVPNFFIDKFRIPPFLLPIYQAAGIEYGVRWEILAAINEIETDYGRNLNVSSAGAMGWMQFIPSSWKAYGVDANGDGVKDPYNPVDAIFAAARYLKAAGADTDIRRAIFAYNHADWYVDSVLLRARVIGGLPSNFVASLTGLTQGRFPVAEKATYSGETDDTISIFAEAGAAIVAVNDGRLLRSGDGSLVLRDAYGNTYTYSNLDPAEKLTAPAPTFAEAADQVARASEPTKQRLFANPARPEAESAGGKEQKRAFDFLRTAVNRKALAPGVRVTEGTVLGRLRSGGLSFSIRPAGRGAPLIDPKPILDGWKLLESSAVYRTVGRNPFQEAPPTIGQVLLMEKGDLQRQVLADPRVELYACGREDVRAGRIDRRVLATLSFLSLSGLRPSVTSLKCGHSYLTASGNVSHHSSGNAVDIARINGVPILGHQGAGSITDIAVQRLLTLQGLMRPAQIITLMEYSGHDNAVSMADHADHIHVGYQPLYGTNAAHARKVNAMLEPDQWIRLIDRLGRIENPKLVGD